MKPIKDSCKSNADSPKTLPKDLAQDSRKSLNFSATISLLFFKPKGLQCSVLDMQDSCALR